MKRYKAFLKHTWWLWAVYVLVTVLLIAFLSPVFLAVIPMMVVMFIYFALVRYDEDGNFIGA
jgi:cobalamin synthase